MRAKRALRPSVAAIAVISFLTGFPSGPIQIARAAKCRVQYHIGVRYSAAWSGPNRPEAGVWVIAETTDLLTKFAKIVVTDDQGRYLLPSCRRRIIWSGSAAASHRLRKVAASPGNILNLAAVPAPSAAAAAEYYPAIYWWSMLRIPDKSLFPGTGPQGNGMPTGLRSQSRWLAGIKTFGCYSCHQLGNKATRTIPSELGRFDSSFEAWVRRVQSGMASEIMARNLGELDTQRALKLFADWTDGIAAGELPFAKPDRPQGIERNVVVSLWDWSSPKAYLHDEIATDKRNPTVNANGPLYGSPEDSTDLMPILDPTRHAASEVKAQVRDPKTRTRCSSPPPTCRCSRLRCIRRRAAVEQPDLDPQSDAR